MIYTFHTKRGTATSTYDLTCSGDLDARRKAEGSATCVRVETPQGRVVWRRPLTPSEFKDVMAGKRAPRPTTIDRPFAMPGLQGDLTEWLDRKKGKPDETT